MMFRFPLSEFRAKDNLDPRMAVAFLAIEKAWGFRGARCTEPGAEHAYGFAGEPVIVGVSGTRGHTIRLALHAPACEPYLRPIEVTEFLEELRERLEPIGFEVVLEAEHIRVTFVA